MLYHIHKKLQDAAIWTLPISKGQKGQTKVNIELVRDFDEENISVKLQNDTGNSCRVIMFTRQLDLWASLKVQKGHTKVNVELGRDFYVENIHVKLQHHTGNLWRVIAFTRFRTPHAQATTIPFSLRGLRGKNGIGCADPPTLQSKLSAYPPFFFSFYRTPFILFKCLIIPTSLPGRQWMRYLLCYVLHNSPKYQQDKNPHWSDDGVKKFNVHVLFTLES